MASGDSSAERTKRRLVWAGAFLCGGALFSLFPLFHVVPLHRAQLQQQAANFDAPTFVREFWDTKLLVAADRGTPLADLCDALATDPVAAKSKFGHSPGMSSVTYFFVKGSGKVATVEKDGVRVVLDGRNPERTVELSTGLVFGNAVRDGSGLLNGGDYPNSQDFNNISTELNRFVETSVLPALREKAAPGKALDFAGCVELEEGTPPQVLRVIPVKVSWQ